MISSKNATTAPAPWRWNLLCIFLAMLTLSSTLAQSSLRGQTTRNGDQQMEKEQGEESQHRNLLQVDALREAFQVARAKYHNKLELDYGTEHVGTLFRDEHPFIPERETTIGRTTFATTVPNANVSWTRLVRKMTLKIIDAQQTPTSFVWATGGHSASAGHGNLFNESYTNILNANAPPIFQAVGLKFEARNHAMGGTSSGVEIAACSKEVFGLDVDLISWDYGMCDGREYVRAEMFFRRAAMIPSRPAVVMLNTNNDRGRWGVAQFLSEQGYTALAMDEGLIKNREKLFPDCAAIPLEDVAKLPRYVQNFRCGTAIEKGEPLCDATKWTDTGNVDCEKRRFRTSWHPGWKWHAWRSHIHQFFLIEIIDDALALLQSPEAIGDPTAFAQKLREAEEKEYQDFMAKNDFQGDGVRQGWPQNDVSMETLFKSPNYCHTARLAADIRTKGILTGRTDLAAQGQIDTGIEFVRAQTQTTASEMPLVFEQATRQVCVHELQNDFKDFFFVSGKYPDYASLTLPTDSEIQAYGGPHSLKGVIVVCGAACGWRCPAQSVDVVEGVYTGDLKFRVNGLDVKNVTKIDACAYLQMPDGQSHVFPANAQGRFEIAAKVMDPGKYTRLSSIIVW